MDVLRNFRSGELLRTLVDRREEAQRVLKGMDLELQDALRQAEAERKVKEAGLLLSDAGRRQKQAARPGSVF